MKTPLGKGVSLFLRSLGSLKVETQNPPGASPCEFKSRLRYHSIMRGFRFYLKPFFM